jgi:hypothetical protein
MTIDGWQLNFSGLYKFYLLIYLRNTLPLPIILIKLLGCYIVARCLHVFSYHWRCKKKEKSRRTPLRTLRLPPRLHMGSAVIQSAAAHYIKSSEILEKRSISNHYKPLKHSHNSPANMVSVTTNKSQSCSFFKLIFIFFNQKI